MYSCLRKLLFLLPPEVAHKLVLSSLQLAYRLKLSFLFPKKIHKPIAVMGLQFDNPIGLAAGLDKNGDYIDGLAMLGFGFLEVGTITPRPQPGNPKPRMFRLVEDEALINRMGFNNEGAEHLLNNLKKINYKGILGINIGKNFDTPNEKAADDYTYLFKTFAPYASYITVNISSPNTKNLRDLQQGDALTDLLSKLKSEQKQFFETNKKYVPLAVKIAPDLSDEALQDVCNTLMTTEIDAVIATNTTISRQDLTNESIAKEAGGLSGKPLTQRATEIVKKIRLYTQAQIPIIASGGVMQAEDVSGKQQAGASLVQIYTGLIYSGPGLVSQSLK